MKISPYYIWPFFLGAFVYLPASAQKTTHHQQMLWLRYSGRYNLSPTWSAALELEDRRFAFPDRQQTWVLPRVSVRRRMGKAWVVGAGFLYYLDETPADPKKSSSLTVPELRPFQEVDLQQQMGRLAVSHRYLLEERWKRKNDGERLSDGYGFNFRFRYQLQLQYPLTEKGRLKLKVADEVFLNFGHAIAANTFDQNRLSAGLNYAVSKDLQVEADYIRQFQEKSSGDTYTSRDILRLTFFQTINFY